MNGSAVWAPSLVIPAREPRLPRLPGPIALKSVDEMIRFWISFRCEYVSGLRALACECDSTSASPKAPRKPAHASGMATRRLADI